jgi:hypothetical protein
MGACLLAQGKTFAGYAEGLPSVGFLGAISGNYASKHAVYTYWQGTGTNNIPASCNRPFTSFPSNFDSLPSVSYVIPDMNNDMHNGLDPTPIVTGDTWLKNNLDGYIQWAQTHNSLFILTFDEDDDLHNNRALTIFSGEMVKKGHYSEVINHYNVLRTLEDIYGICHDGLDSTVTPITDCWLTTATGINETPSPHFNFQIYPNPATNKITVEAEENGKFIMQVTNPLGQQIIKRSFQEKSDIDFSSFGKGFYNVEVLDENGRNSCVKRLIIE